jgi:DNA mismatch endonuclease (patch repair protein)
MRAIRSQHMMPELAVRHLVHELGYRFRLHRKDLPGKPDLVFPSRRKVIFVHGCFWHAHKCKIAHVPKSNTSYWEGKLQRNRERDTRNIQSLNAANWESLVIWECELKDGAAVGAQVKAFLEAKGRQTSRARTPDHDKTLRTA